MSRTAHARKPAAEADNRKAYCVYCGFIAESESRERTREIIVEHVVACEKNLFRVEADRLGGLLTKAELDRGDALELLGESDRALETARARIAELKAERDRLRNALRKGADHLLSMSQDNNAHHCAGCGLLHKEWLEALGEKP